MSKRLKQLIKEFEERKKCSHGFYQYPTCWMVKTQEKAIDNGDIEKCDECSTPGFNYLKRSQ